MHETFPSQLPDESAIAFGAKVQRAAASPRAAVALFNISMQLNVADVLPTRPDPHLGAASVGTTSSSPPRLAEQWRS